MTEEENARIEAGIAKFCVWCHKNPRKQYRSREVVMALAECFAIPDDDAQDLYADIRRKWREYAERVDA